MLSLPVSGVFCPLTPTPLPPWNHVVVPLVPESPGLYLCPWSWSLFALLKLAARGICDLVPLSLGKALHYSLVNSASLRVPGWEEVPLSFHRVPHLAPLHWWTVHGLL